MINQKKSGQNLVNGQGSQQNVNNYTAHRNVQQERRPNQRQHNINGGNLGKHVNDMTVNGSD